MHRRLLTSLSQQTRLAECLEVVPRILGGGRNCLQNSQSQQNSTREVSSQGTQSLQSRKGFHSKPRGFATTAAIPLEKDGIISSPYQKIELNTTDSLNHYLLDDFERYGESIALIDGVTGRTVTYRQLKDDIVKTASALSRMGLKKGDIVTLFAPNSIEWATFYIGASCTGAIVSAVNPLYTQGELSHAVGHAESQYIITIPALVPVAKAAKEQCPTVKEIILFGEEEGCRPFSNLLEDDGKAFPENVTFDPLEDPLALPYSSGTTGLPKGVVLTHSNVVANIQQIRHPEALEYGPEDTLLAVLPMFHIYGQVVVLLSGLKGGARIVTVPKFDPELYLNCVSKHQVSYLHIVPPIILFLAKHPMMSNYDLSSVQTLFTGAAPIGPESMQAVIDRLGGDKIFRQGYGLTEASPVTHANQTDPSKIKLHTIGPAIANTEFKVVDLETDEPLGVGEEGELCVRGPQVMKGYFKNQQATDDTIKNGWLHTGDIGYYDKDGHTIISDRLKELIKFKGFQVAPAELEALLVTHPAIQDAAVIGKPDEKAGELPRAYVVLKPNMDIKEDDIHDFIKDKVAPFKQLTGGIEFRQEIPKSASGKILRRFLKDELK